MRNSGTLDPRTLQGIWYGSAGQKCTSKCATLVDSGNSHGRPLEFWYGLRRRGPALGNWLSACIGYPPIKTQRNLEARVKRLPTHSNHCVVFENDFFSFAMVGVCVLLVRSLTRTLSFSFGSAKTMLRVTFRQSTRHTFNRWDPGRPPNSTRVARRIPL
jgi:hypothetical protein